MSFFDSIQQLLNSGGNVLWVILWVSMGLWCLIIERLLYFRQAYPIQRERWLQQWQCRADKNSAHALSIRECIISEAKISMTKTIPIISMLVVLCPLLGLLGTVTGMIHVFDVMAVTGSGNARAMASGVSQATIPTMAGMVIAITGLYFSKLIEQKVSEETHHLTDLLQYH
ncbi:MAG: MotA/TolQ/ExbB proton channel family protein [Methylococcales symbiont of Hymedesmia sp. n. MRB-2018]|nr:MAG: MotA/TolQ/ExbB proton channel family protein [Methylococcales symbiont of Hymedesmia sp. n. MRB-2018]KAF3984555.1 MAG: MotA/TolQ/ExbB proton channel family protein [Methylococcales symbiont of Hymedesmia sp. n. MRB-2018]